MVLKISIMVLAPQGAHSVVWDTRVWWAFFYPIPFLSQNAIPYWLGDTTWKLHPWPFLMCHSVLCWVGQASQWRGTWTHQITRLRYCSCSLPSFKGTQYFKDKAEVSDWSCVLESGTYLDWVHHWNPLDFSFLICANRTIILAPEVPGQTRCDSSTTSN